MMRRGTIANPNNYEAVIKPRHFTDAYHAEKGWEVETPDDLAAVSRERYTIRVAPIGHFNVGKTFVVNKLSGKDLLIGEQFHTEGLSVAVTPFAQDENQIAWLDTAGLNSPVVHCDSLIAATAELEEMVDTEASPSELAKGSNQMQELMSTMQGELREVNRLENFHRAVAFEFADVFLFVIGQMSHQDQLNIMMLVHQIELAQASKKHVFVIHNLKDWDQNQLKKKHDDGYTYMERIRALFFMQEQSVLAQGVMDAKHELVVEGKASSGQEVPIKKDIPMLHGTFGSDPRSPVQMHHVFLCNNDLEAEYNAAVLAHVRTAVSQVEPSKESVKATLERVITAAQGQFADLARGKLPPLRIIKAADGKWRLHSVASPRATEAATLPAQPQPLELPSYLTLGSDDLQYDVVRFLGKLPSAREGVAMQKKVMAGVQIVLPGMTPDDVDRIRQRMRFTGADPALRLEKVEGARTLMIDLEAVERVMPEGFLRKTWELAQSPAHLNLGSNPISIESPDFTVVDEGTRSVFSEVVRPVRVQVRTGLRTVSTLTKPTVHYNDGVLSIVVALTNKV